jgi:hypothetical protein
LTETPKAVEPVVEPVVAMKDVQVEAEATAESEAAPVPMEAGASLVQAAKEEIAEAAGNVYISPTMVLCYFADCK